MSRTYPCLWKNDGAGVECWRPATLDQLGKKEDFLEEILFQEPRLLDLESLESGIQGPYRGFRQISFQTPQGRSIRPDIVFLTAGGQAIVVEVKRGSNPELRDRQVIAQVVDYAGSFARLDEEELLRLFRDANGPAGAAASWPEWIAGQFPDALDAEELARLLLARFHDGELHLCIACDKAPPGIRELVEGVASQSALGFDLSLVEVQPYVSDRSPDDILFLPTIQTRTEIVSRTAVTVIYQEGTPKPEVVVQVDSPQQIAAATRRFGRQNRTPLKEAGQLLGDRLADLIAAHVVGQPWIWRGFSLGLEIYLEAVGRLCIYLEIGFFHPDDPTADWLNITFGLRGKKDRRARFSRLKEIVQAETAALNAIVEKSEEFANEESQAHAGWSLQASELSATDWDAAAIADFFEKIVRHLHSRLKFQAGE
ncbi:MAG: hypothetical protein GX444_18990 [Myxococcales bacterium]|nr:hypothetical protein [Myxococcales bacterium]